MLEASSFTLEHVWNTAWDDADPCGIGLEARAHGIGKLWDADAGGRGFRASSHDTWQAQPQEVGTRKRALYGSLSARKVLPLDSSALHRSRALF